jgi:hypothetical protein|tara:strand:+ start:927 stop:1274 length:348 start_codon:yes stop_codon:yes gene_type:complete
MISNWVPEIYYEEADDDIGLTSHIPFISPPADEEMPRILFIFESRETGEFEPGQGEEDLPVIQLDLHQYADMAFLKDGLDASTFDKVREALGLQPLTDAAAEGSRITERIRSIVS